MQAEKWLDCPLISSDPEIVHGAPVFKGTRMPVQTAVENYHAFRELEGMSDEQAVKETLECFPTIPGVEGLRAVLAYEAAHEHQLKL